LDKTADSALCQLRASIIRDGLDGLAHAEALLAMRAVALERVPRKIPADSCGRREVKLIVLAPLRDGPKTATQIGGRFMVANPEIAPDRSMKRVWRSICGMRDRGVVRREGRLWGLAAFCQYPFQARLSGQPMAFCTSP
jgi:hypothetical protein